MMPPPTMTTSADDGIGFVAALQVHWSPECRWTCCSPVMGSSAGIAVERQAYYAGQPGATGFTPTAFRRFPGSAPVTSAPPTLLLSRSVIAGLATTQDYLAAMHDAFTGLAEQSYRLPDAAYVPAKGGGFHVKSASRLGAGAMAVIKVNGNFPGNGVAWSLPTIQGFIAVLDAERGRVLAIMDSIEITARRTAATTALAARHLARGGSRTLGIIGCGAQARYHVEALRDVAPLETIFFCDSRDAAA